SFAESCPEFLWRNAAARKAASHADHGDRVGCDQVEIFLLRSQAPNRERQLCRGDARLVGSSHQELLCPLPIRACSASSSVKPSDNPSTRESFRLTPGLSLGFSTLALNSSAVFNCNRRRK